MEKRLIFLLAAIVFASACEPMVLVESEYNSKDAVFDNKVTFSVVEDPLVLSLDSLTSPVTSTVQYINEDEDEYLAIWNNNDRSILVFDLKYGKVIKKQVFVREGPNTVYATNFLIHSKDSIFMTDGVQSTYLVSSDSKVLNRYPVEDTHELKKSPGPYVWTGSPMIFFNNSLYFQAYIGGVFNQPNIARLSLNSKEVDYFGGYPEFYTKGYWRGGFEYMHLTYNEEDNLIVQSYTADHYVRVLNLRKVENEQMSYFAGTNDFPFLKPPREKMDDPGHELDDRKFMLQPSFGIIHYDKFRKLYYRFAYDALTESDLNSGDPKRATIKPSRVIILNSSFEKVGEYQLPRFKYKPHMSFVGKDGLHIKIENEENEDVIEFEILKPIDVENE